MFEKIYLKQIEAVYISRKINKREGSGFAKEDVLPVSPCGALRV